MTKRAKLNIELAHMYPTRQDVRGMLTDEQRRSIDLTQEIIERLGEDATGATLCVLIDDYSAPCAVDPARLRDEILSHGLSVDFIVNESRIAHFVDCFIERLPRRLILVDGGNTIFSTKTNSFLLWETTAGGKRRDFLETFVQHTLGDDKRLRLPHASMASHGGSSHSYSSSATLKSCDLHGGGKYSCAVLTACWHMARLGVPPFSALANEATAFSDKPFPGERIVTLLPVKYLKVEALAWELIASANTKVISKKKKMMEYRFFQVLRSPAAHLG